jgi:hypothetical protein
MSKRSPQQDENNFRAILNRYFRTTGYEPVVDALVTIYSQFEVVKHLMGGDVTTMVDEKELGNAAVRNMMQFTVAWAQNPFIIRHGAVFMHTVGMTQMAILDGLKYREESVKAKERGDDANANELASRALACFAQLTNIVLSALALHEGVSVAVAQGKALRDELWRQE